MIDPVDRDPEHGLATHHGAADSTVPLRIVEHDRLHRQPETQGDDREVDPAVRTAGSANANPNGTVPTIPSNAASSKGTPDAATRRAAMNAPMPASAHCPSEICPQKPVTSTIESRTMPKINEVVIASTHFCESTNSSAAVAAVTPTMTPGRSRPVPSGAGGRTHIRGSATPCR